MHTPPCSHFSASEEEMFSFAILANLFLNLASFPLEGFFPKSDKLSTFPGLLETFTTLATALFLASYVALTVSVPFHHLLFYLKLT